MVLRCVSGARFRRWHSSRSFPWHRDGNAFVTAVAICSARARFFAEFTSPFGVTTPLSLRISTTTRAQPLCVARGLTPRPSSMRTGAPRHSECDDATRAFLAAVRLFAFPH